MFRERDIRGDFDSGDGPGSQSRLVVSSTRRGASSPAWSSLREIREAKLLLDWLLTRSQSLQVSQVSQREILVCGPNRVRNKERRDRVLSILEEHRFLRQLQDGNRHLIELNPCLL